MSDPAVVVLTIPTETLDILVERLAERIATDTRPQHTDERWLGVAEAASYLRCPRSRIYDLVAQRDLRCARDGRRLLFRRAWLDGALDRGDDVPP